MCSILVVAATLSYYDKELECACRATVPEYFYIYGQVKFRKEKNMTEEEETRLELQAIPTMHQNSPYYGITDNDTYYTVSHLQLRDLIGKLLTLLDAMNLPDRVHHAQKALIVQSVWQWWDGVYENSTTSYKGCIAPIVITTELDAKISGDIYPSNRWTFNSEEEYLEAVGPPQNDIEQ